MSAMSAGAVGTGYADHLTDTDLSLLAAVGQLARGSAADTAASLRRHAEKLPELLADPRTFQAVFGPGDPTAGPGALASLASPFLIFAVAVHAAAAELESTDHLPERLGPRQRVPLFDGPQLRDFLGSPARRLFLAELLASFTRNRDGRYHEPAADAGGQQPGMARRQPGYRGARRFSELDLPRMAGQLDDVAEADRPGVYRRLGDVALFLTGVFPDYAITHELGPVNAARLLRSAQVPARQREELAAAPAIDLFEYLGAQWYRAAWALAQARTARLAVVAEVADRFRQARRVLNHIADGRLFASGDPWFAPPAR